MYTLPFTLKQHTPLIHFQHDQEGATLRASEVKSKLDKFIINLCQGEDICRASNHDWFSVKDLPALNYKMRIARLGEQFCFTKNIVSVEKNLVLYESLDVQLLSNEKTLLNKIKELIVDFFIVTNFGNRTSKGYGSFMVQSIQGDTVLTPYGKYRDVLSNIYKLFGAIDIDKDYQGLYNISGNNLFQLKKRDFSTETEERDYKNLNTFQYSISQINTDITFLYANRDQRNQIMSDFETKANAHKILLIKKFPKLKVKIENSFSKNIELKKKEIIVTYYNYMLDEIEKDNRLLKSGQNPGRSSEYRKSELFLQFIAYGIIWEKRLMKKLINALTLPERSNKNLEYRNPPSIDNELRNNTWDDTFKNSDYRFIRALLGLPEQYEFKTNDVKFKFVVQFESDGAERYQSPLLFKIIDNYIFVCLTKDYTSLCCTSFNMVFIVKEKINDKWEERKRKSIYSGLSVPSVTELNTVGFINFLETFFNEMSYA